MRRLITILMVVAFGVMTLSTPALAWGPDDPRYGGGSDRYEETDEGGWGELQRKSDDSIGTEADQGVPTFDSGMWLLGAFSVLRSYCTFTSEPPKIVEAHAYAVSRPPGKSRITLSR